MELLGRRGEVTVSLIECLEPLDEVGVHVVGVYPAGVDLRKVPVKVVRHVARHPRAAVAFE